MSQNGIHYTPTEQLLIAVLSDGLWHSKHELLRALNDSEASIGAVAFHICMIRKKLKTKGETVVCEHPGPGRVVGYRHVRLLTSAVDGTN